MAWLTPVKGKVQTEVTKSESHDNSTKQHQGHSIYVDKVQINVYYNDRDSGCAGHRDYSEDED